MALSARSRLDRARVVAVCLVVATALAGCGTTASAPSATRPAPGAVLRHLDALALGASHVPFEAGYRAVVPVSPTAVRTERFTIGRRGGRSLLVLAGTESLSVGQGTYVCRQRECVAAGYFPTVLPSSDFGGLADLVEGRAFVDATQDYPVRAADLAARGVSLRLADRTIAGQPSSCVTFTYSATPAGTPPHRPAYRTQRWCVASDGLVTSWSAGRRSLELTWLTRRPHAAAFAVPYRVTYPKASAAWGGDGLATVRGVAAPLSGRS